MLVRHRVTARRVAAENTRFEVFFDRVERDEAQDGAQDGGGGDVVPAYLMIRPRIQHADKVAGVCVLPVVGGRIGLMRAMRPHFSEPIWVAPSGFVEADEPTSDSARRELEEETGLTCRPEDLRSLGLLLLDPGVLEARVALYAALDAAPLAAGAPIGAPIGPAGGAEIGVGGLHFFDEAEAEALAISSPSMDGATVAACLRYLALGRLEKAK